MGDLAKLIGYALVLCLIVLGYAALCAFPVKWLWNWLLPSIFNLRHINVFEAWGMLALCGLLFRSTLPNQKEVK